MHIDVVRISLLQLFRISTNLQTGSQTSTNFFRQFRFCFGLEIGSSNCTISKTMESDLPVLELCNSLTGVTGALFVIDLKFIC